MYLGTSVTRSILHLSQAVSFCFYVESMQVSRSGHKLRASEPLCLLNGFGITIRLFYALQNFLSNVS